MTSEHPTYPNPTIHEAVCEVRFAQTDSQQWGASFFSNFSEKVRESYPSFEPVQQHAVQVAFGPQGVLPQAIQIEQRMRYKSNDGTKMLQLGPSSFVVNFLPKYPGWDTFEKEILDNWKNVITVTGARKIVRVGLRYINKLPPIESGKSLSFWLKESSYLPKELINSKHGGFFRLETIPVPGRRVIVTVGQQEEAASSTGEFMFDIDCSSEELNEDQLATTLKGLHDDAWKVFSGSATDDLIRYLKKSK